MKAHNPLSKDRIKSRIVKILIGTFLLMFVALTLFPFAYMVVMSFFEEGHTLRLTWELMKKSTWSFIHYIRIFERNNFLRYFWNTFLVTVMSCTGTVILSTLAAYAFGKKKFVGKDLIYTIFLSTMMIPGVAVMIPRYLQIRDLGLLNTHLGIALPAITGAFGTILLRSFMKNVPDELLEAAELDGCGEVGRFIHIVLPLIKPALISLVVFVAVSAWSDYLWPILVTSDSDMNVLTVAVANMKDVERTNYGFIMAGAATSFLPPLILYCFLQKEFVEGIALSGTKG